MVLSCGWGIPDENTDREKQICQHPATFPLDEEVQGQDGKGIAGGGMKSTISFIEKNEDKIGLMWFSWSF